MIKNRHMRTTPFLTVIILVTHMLFSSTVTDSYVMAETSLQKKYTNTSNPPPPSEMQSSMVVVDGKNLFRVIGIKSYPAQKRARKIARKIIQVAEDPSFDPATLSIREKDDAYVIDANDLTIVRIFEADVVLEGQFSPAMFVDRVIKKQISNAITNYRYERLPSTIKGNLLKALYRTVALALILVFLFWSFKKTDQLLEQHFKRKIETLESKSKKIFQGRQIWNVFRLIIRISRIVLVLVVIYIFLNFVLGLFPWSRYLAYTLLGYVVGPLKILSQSFIDYLPRLFYLIIIYMIFRYLLGITKAFFDQLERGQLTITGFDAEWALPTYRIIRALVVILGIIIAYPYIPGSGSEAFKGISILIGILFSLGSSSLIANMIAGYTMTYRRAFRVGDLVKFGINIGTVTDVRLLETHLRSLKNEEIVIPNSKILNSEIINYSSMAAHQGLILHTTVGIGYEVPWRQVEAMLLMAAKRTPGLDESVEPFVLQKELGDFGIIYELNVICRSADNMMRIYSALHANIQDIFNEYEIAIMTPHYVGDTDSPKIVPKDGWYAAPASPPE